MLKSPLSPWAILLRHSIAAIVKIRASLKFETIGQHRNVIESKKAARRKLKSDN